MCSCTLEYMNEVSDITLSASVGLLNLTAHLDAIREFTLPADADGPTVESLLGVLITLRNAVDHLMAVHVSAAERLGVAKVQGRTTVELLMHMGLAPGTAQRVRRIAGALDSVGTVSGYAADGAMSGEHVDAIVRGLDHIEKRSAEPVDDAARRAFASDLAGQYFSGLKPAEIFERARTLGNQIAVDNDGLPAAEDRSINALSLDRDDGRVRIRGDLDAVTGERLITVIDALSAPQPQPDGSRDPRSPQQICADALETLLVMAERGAQLERSEQAGLRSAQTGGGPQVLPPVQLALTIPAGAPELSSLRFVGAITEATARRLSCDASVSVMIVDGEEVPLAVGKERRLFTRAQRRALNHRDKGCVKCGAPASWAHAHHIVHWADGGDTDVDNGALLCPRCHDDVHHRGWGIYLGSDKHPWLIPPATVDPKRTPVPSYHRRTLTLTGLSDAA